MAQFRPFGGRLGRHIYLQVVDSMPFGRIECSKQRAACNNSLEVHKNKGVSKVGPGYHINQPDGAVAAFLSCDSG